jgi:hypothetical protein
MTKGGVEDAGKAVKMNEVARNQIWREHLKKEMMMEGPQTSFQFNPKTCTMDLTFHILDCIDMISCSFMCMRRPYAYIYIHDLPR